VPVFGTVTSHQDASDWLEKPVPTYRELRTEATFIAWRALRWTLMAAGQMTSNTPLQVALGRANWGQPLRAQDPDPSCRTLPGVLGYDLQSVRLQPPRLPDPLDPEMLGARRAAWDRFDAQMVMAVRGYALDRPADDCWWSAHAHRPLYTEGVLIGTLGPEDTDRIRRLIWWHWPTPEEILQLESAYLTAILERLRSSSDEGVWRELLRGDCRTTHEAYSLVQTAKRWALEERTLDPEVERAAVAHRMGLIAEKSIAFNELPTALSANRELAKLHGLYKDAAKSELEDALSQFAEEVERARLANPAKAPEIVLPGGLDASKIIDTTASITVPEFGGTLPSSIDDSEAEDCNIDSNPDILNAQINSQTSEQPDD